MSDPRDGTTPELYSLHVMNDDGEWKERTPPVRGGYSFVLGWKNCMLVELYTLCKILPVTRPQLTAAAECGGYNEGNASE